MIQFIVALRELYTDQWGVTDRGSELPAQQDGQGLVEYGLILAFIAIMVIIALIFFGSQLTVMYSKLGNSIPTT